MRAKWISKCVIGFLLMVAVATWVFMYVWNAVIPDVFHLSTIDYWQALGILVLSKLIFKGGGNGWMMRNRFNNHWKQKLENMSPEEKEKFREQWEQRCSKWGRSDKQENA